MKIKTIQRRDKLNHVRPMGQKGNGGAYHMYEVSPATNNDTAPLITIQFQDGARKSKGSKTGVIDVDLLEIARHRLQCFQEGEFATRENEMALIHIEEALMWLNKRVEDRKERNVLGTDKK